MPNYICDNGHISYHSRSYADSTLKTKCCPKCGASVKATYKTAPYSVGSLISKETFRSRPSNPISNFFQNNTTISTTSPQIATSSNASNYPPQTHNALPTQHIFPTFPSTPPSSHPPIPILNPTPIPTFVPTPIPSPSIEEKVEAKNSFDDSSFINLQANFLIKESQSQEQMYIYLVSANYMFLCRDKQFRAYKASTTALADDETVPEPGLYQGGYVMGQSTSGKQVVLGRNESGKSHIHFKKGTTTYPDYYVKLDNRIFAIELKTPRESTLSSFLSSHFLDEKVFTDGRTVEEELTYRRTILDLQSENVDQVILFDLSNITKGDPLRDICNFINYTHQRRQWFETNINRYLFHGDREGIIEFKPVTLGEIESAVKFCPSADVRAKFSKGRQQGITAFFPSSTGK